MNPLIYVAAAVLVAVMLWFVTHKTGQDDQADSHIEENINQPIAGSSGRRRRNAGMGIRQRAQGLQQPADEDISEGDKIHKKEGKIGTKKLKKLQEKEERKRQRELEAQEREERKKEQEEQDKLRRKEEEEKLIEEQRIAEEKRLQEEEKQRQEHEEYLKLKEMFSVDEEGQHESASDEQSQNMLQEFVDYIKMKKVVLLEDLGSHFGLRTQDAIDRVQNMLKDEILTGVVDDRGKFIYISQKELKAVAKYINQHGRVSISDLAQASNSLISLVADKKTIVS